MRIVHIICTRLNSIFAIYCVLLRFEKGDSVMFAITALKGHYEAGTLQNGEVTQGKFVGYLEPLTAAAREKRYVIRPFKYDPSKANGVDSGIQLAESQVFILTLALTLTLTINPENLTLTYAGWTNKSLHHQMVQIAFRRGVFWLDAS
jgi:hypothetical protein